MLNLIEGWDYRDYYTDYMTVSKNNHLMLADVKKTGWLTGISIFTDDVYGTIRLTYKGPSGREITVNIYPEAAIAAGNWSTSPSGYILKYYRPDPNKTTGIYAIQAFDGYYGTPLPFSSPATLEGILGDSSTESSAQIAISADVIEIKDMTLFRKSMKALNLYLNGRLPMSILDELSTTKRDIQLPLFQQEPTGRTIPRLPGRST
jgi:hypothetical protein